MVFSIAQSIEQTQSEFFSNAGKYLIKSFAEPDCVIKKETSSWFDRLCEVIGALFAKKQITPYSLKDNINYLSQQEIGAKDLESADKVERFVTAVLNIVTKKKDANLTQLMEKIIENAKRERQELEDKTTEVLINSGDELKIKNAISLIKSSDNVCKLEEKAKSIQVTARFISLLNNAADKKNRGLLASIAKELETLQGLTEEQTKLRDVAIRKLGRLIGLHQI